MSYILDALKKADAERERASVPGLHARPVTVAAPNAPAQRKTLWLALLAGLALAGVAAMVWNGHAPDAGSAPPPVPVAAQPLPPAPMAVPPAPPQPAAESAAAPPPPAAKPTAPAPAKTLPAVAASPKPVAAVSAAPATAVPTPLLSELPANIRAQIPPLAISGSVYSDNPAQRLLIINGQVLPQGSPVAPDVTLLEIQRGRSEFSFRGTRFTLAH